MKKFIICVFGESSAGKSTLLRGLISDIMLNSKYAVCDAEGFQSKDRRMAAWYRTGKSRQGIVAIGTPGDSWDIINANIKFFEKHLHLWNEWYKNKTTVGKRRCKNKCEEDKKKGCYFECPKKGEYPSILITSARMPLHEYKEWGKCCKKYEVLNIPMDVEVWYLKDDKKDVDWMSPIRLTAESIMDNIRYILINKKIKTRSSAKKRKIKLNRTRASVSRD